VPASDRRLHPLADDLPRRPPGPCEHAAAFAEDDPAIGTLIHGHWASSSMVPQRCTAWWLGRRQAKGVVAVPAACHGSSGGGKSRSRNGGVACIQLAHLALAVGDRPAERELAAALAAVGLRRAWLVLCGETLTRGGERPAEDGEGRRGGSSAPDPRGSRARLQSSSAGRRRRSACTRR
jgi:hypothetical protein